MGKQRERAIPDSRPLDIDEQFERFNVGRNGLDSAEVAKRREQYGANALQEEKVNPLLKFLHYFWGPIPWMIEVAALLSLVVGDLADFGIILVMLLFNGLVGFWQEYQASNAIAQLKKNLALRARVRRDDAWQEIPASELVPGDIIHLRLGDIIPADAMLVEGNYLSIDQSALTGESLPVEKGPGEVAYSGSVAKQGEMTALVSATGMHTFFGKTAHLVDTAKNISHFQRAVLTIGDYLIYLSLGLVAILVLVGLHRGENLLQLAQFALILTVAAIPVAMPAVLSVTMAIGALMLSKRKVIVSRLEAIEEMAGMDILCSDKTGTLTRNELTLGKVVLFAASDAQALLSAAALASRGENGDAIDNAILQQLHDHKWLNGYQLEHFTPFDPVSKRSEARVHDAAGKVMRVSKGAPQVIARMTNLGGDELQRFQEKVDEQAAHGFRTIGVARLVGEGPWEFLGLLTLYDPPREDAAATIAEATAHGIDVKMVTGDNLAIGREIAGQLGLGRNILPAEQLEEHDYDIERVEQADGFAQVFPEHKYCIVKQLQKGGHLVGMTGDGVNDAPALKQADVGIAVTGATDAARAAADIVLTEPGLSVITHAIEEARRIFERMNSYAIYRITETIRITIFVVLAMLVYQTYPITAVMIILLALLNDLPIMAIAYDNTWLPPRPVRWQMRRVLTLAAVLGAIGVVETFALMVIAKNAFGFDTAHLQSLIFLKLVVAGHLTLLVARSRGAFFSRPYPAPVLLWAVLGTQLLAACIVGFGWFVEPIGWTFVGIVWLYCLFWVFIEDWAKRILLTQMEWRGKRHRQFIDMTHASLFEESGCGAGEEK